MVVKLTELQVADYLEPEPLFCAPFSLLLDAGVAEEGALARVWFVRSLWRVLPRVPWTVFIGKGRWEWPDIVVCRTERVRLCRRDMVVRCGRQWAALNDLVLDAGTCYGQVRRVNMDWVDGLVEQFTGNPPKELELTV